MFLNKISLPNLLIPVIGLLLTAQCQAQKTPKAITAEKISFTKQTLTNEFLAEGVAVGDVNRDGKIDVMAGAYWFEAPNWIRHELDKPVKYFYDKGYSDSFIGQAMDVNQDGWIDLLRVGFPGKETAWHENPKGKAGHWPVHIIHPTVGNESAGFVDIDGDGRLDLLGPNYSTRTMSWYKSPNSKTDLTWKQYPISEPKSPGTDRFSHGLGFSDVNNDNRKDVIIREGWWEAPANPTQGNWMFHPANLGEACSQMYAYDFDKDGDQDVVSASAHARGMWWHEQTKDAAGAVQWTKHDIYDKFTQTHAVSFTDINSDGNPDLVTGKRYFAHMGKDLGEFEPAVLYWFELKPGKNPTWIPHLIDDNSGVGTQVHTQDITKDGLTDIIVANKKGVFVFTQVRKN